MAEKTLQMKVEADLNCLVCLDTYTDPKLLHCHHVFCRGCIERLVDRDQQGQLILTCPTCRKVTPVPAMGVAGLQPAFHINHLLDTLQEHKKAMGDARYCPEHPTRELESFCETCHKLICLECAVEKHNGHNLNLVSKLFEKYREEILSSLKPVEDRLSHARITLDELDLSYGEILDQQDSIEASICDHTRQIQEVAEFRKNELISKLHHLMAEKLQDLVSKRVEIETTIAQLSSYEDTVHKSLETSSQGEVVKMKASIQQQAEELTNEFPLDNLQVTVEHDTVFSTKPNVIEACRSFGSVSSHDSPDPEKCYAVGKGLEEASVGETSTMTLRAIDFRNEPCVKLVRSIQCVLFSELTATAVVGYVERTGQYQYKINYQPTIKGRHQLHIQISGQHIRGSPFSVEVKSEVKKLGPPIINFKADGPWAVAVNQKRELIVTETETSCVSVFSPTGERLRSFETQGIGRVRGVAVDDEGNILVADEAKDCIQQLTAEGKVIRVVGTKGSGPLKFNWPCDIAFNASNRKVYVVDENDCVQVLNSDLTFSSTFGKHGSGKGQFNYPAGVACDSTGKVYVADSNNNRIQIFTAEGKFWKMFGNTGKPHCRLKCPESLAVDGNNMVYVGQTWKHCVSVFTCEGQFVTSFSTHPEYRSERSISGLAVNSNGVVYVCDFLSCNVEIF